MLESISAMCLLTYGFSLRAENARALRSASCASLREYSTEFDNVMSMWIVLLYNGVNYHQTDKKNADDR